MTFLLDTNTCIKYLNGTSEKVHSTLESKQPRDIVLCSVVKAELLFGAFKSCRPKKNLEKVKRFFKPFISLPFEDKASEAYGQIRVNLEKSGTPIGPNDLLIAAIAMANKVTLVTHNIRKFGRVKGIYLEDWESDQ